MTDAKWQEFFHTAVSLGVYGETLNWKSAYTLQFLG
jgi:hypothetical protein